MILEITGFGQLRIPFQIFNLFHPVFKLLQFSMLGLMQLLNTDLQWALLTVIKSNVKYLFGALQFIFSQIFPHWIFLALKVITLLASLNTTLTQGGDKSVLHAHTVFLEHAALLPCQNYHSTYWRHSLSFPLMVYFLAL